MAEWDQEFGGEVPQDVRSLMSEVVDGQMAARMSAAQRAITAWYRANGDRERNHTTGVFIRPSHIDGTAPILCVYVDSHAMATDFGVNKDIYLARLANIGYEVSGIEFLPSRDRYQKRATSRAMQEQAPEALPELDARELATVQSLVSELPADLKVTASKAISLSMRRKKLEQSRIDKQS